MTLSRISLETGVTLEYSLSGPEQAQVLCFVHGASADLRQFEAQQRYFQNGYRVLLVSLRGHGGSSAPTNPSLQDYSREMLARDLLALWDNLGVAKAHVVGNSLGGLVGYELLRLAPQRLYSLTTFGTTAALNSPKTLVWTLLTLNGLLGPRGMGWLFSKTASRDASVARRVGEMCRSANKDALRLITQNLAVYDYTALLEEQSLPILLIRAALDRDINTNLTSTLTALNKTPNFTRVELSGAGHFANLERPADFNEILTDFLGQFQTAGSEEQPHTQYASLIASQPGIDASAG